MIRWDVHPSVRGPVDEIIATPRFIRVCQINPRSLRRFRLELQDAMSTGQPVLPVVLDCSPGGDVYSALAMGDLIEEARRDGFIVSTSTEGLAASAGAFIMTFGSEGYRYAAKSSTIMIHEAQSSFSGKNVEVSADAKETSRLTREMMRIMDSNCKKPSGFFSDMIHDNGHADLYLSASKAKKIGLVNHVGIPQMMVKVSVDYGYGMVK